MVFATVIQLVALVNLFRLVLAASQVQPSYEERCGYPGWPTNGYYNKSADPYTISYSCVDEVVTQLTGTKERKCLDNGLWDLPIPSCDLNLVHDAGVKILCVSREAKHNCSLSKKFQSSLKFSSAISTARFLSDTNVTFGEIKVTVRVTDDQDSRLLNSTRVAVRNATNTTLDCLLVDNSVTTQLVKLKFDCNGSKGDELEVAFDASYVQMFRTEIYGQKNGESSCGVPDVPINAQYYHEKENRIYFRCNPGYELANTSNSLECQGRTWKGIATPSCLKKSEREIAYSTSEVLNFVLAAIVCLLFVRICIGFIIRWRQRR